MKWMQAAILGLAVVTTTFVSAEDAPKFDAKKLEGKWMITSGTKAGEKADTTKYKDPVVISDKKIVLKSEEGSFVFNYTVDAKASPVAIDMEIVEPEAFAGTKGVGIIKLDGKKLTLIYSPMGGDRPKEFKSTADNGMYMFEMEMKKKEDK